VLKYSLISFGISASILIILLAVPYTRTRIIDYLDRLADWHEEGTKGAHPYSPMNKGEKKARLG
jgi:hypothetical protein